MIFLFFLTFKTHTYSLLVILGSITYKNKASKTLNWRLFNFSNYLQAI